MSLRLYASVIAIIVCSVHGSAQQPVTFSIQAHQDDWQLFMSNAVINDIGSGKKVVFITLTAGDAGNGTGAYGSTTPYYIAREKGAVQSSKFVADLPGAIPTATPLATTVNINGHNITKYVYKKTVDYFLRLPDGGGNGAGSQLTGFKSLQRLKTGAITSIGAIDGSTTYFGWDDLKQTLLQIVLNEKSTGYATWVYAPGLGTSNAGDHSDHIYSSTAIQEAVANYLWVGINEFIDYASGGQPANLTSLQQSDAAGAFASYVWGLNSAQYVGNFDDGHKSWLPVDFSTVKRNPVGQTPFSNLIQQPESIDISVIAGISSSGKNKDVVEIIINPNETGSLQIEVLNSSNSKIYSNSIIVKEKAPIIIPVSKSLLTAGNFVVNVISDNKYSESKNITIK